MPLESISCTKCGSTDFKEVKPDTYFCNHCDSVFKRANEAQGGPISCEVGACGVMAMGRCDSCGHAFCSTHQARDFKTIFSALCNQCHANRIAEEGRTKYEAHLKRVAQVVELSVDPIDRLIRALTLAVGYQLGGPVVSDISLLCDACPEFFPSVSIISGDLDGKGPWDDKLIVSWFFQRTAALGLKPPDRKGRHSTRKSLLGATKYVMGKPEPAWVLKKCYRVNREDIVIFSDHYIEFGFGERRSYGRLTVRALTQMGEIVKLDPWKQAKNVSLPSSLPTWESPPPYAR
jgi:hypothetical protein